MVLNKGDVVVAVNDPSNGYWQKIQLGSGKFAWLASKYVQPFTPPVLAALVCPWMDVALRELNVCEAAGHVSNQRVLEYLRSTTLNTTEASTDETPWCSAFANFCVEAAGFAGTDSAWARSWLKWGASTDAPVYGDVVVFDRVLSDGTHGGHVAFYMGEGAASSSDIRVLGGNQHDKVCHADYSKAKVLGYRTLRKSV